MARRVERLEAGRRDELLTHVGGQPPDVPAPLQMVVHRPQRVGSLAVRRQAPPRANDQRQMLDAHRTLLLARAARRALPQHSGLVLLGQLRVESPGEQGDFVLEDQLLRIEQLPCRVGRAVHLAPAALDARERVEHLLLLEVTHGLEADLLLLEVEVPHIAELWRLEKHGGRRQHEVEVLRVGNQRQEHQQDDGVQPPVDRRGQPLVQVEHLPQERDHQRGDERANQHRFPRQRPEGLRPHRHPPDDEPDDPDQHRRRERDERPRVPLEHCRLRDVDDPQAGSQLRATVADEGDESPEDEGMRHADQRLLGDDLRLEHDLADEPRGADGEVAGLKRPRGPAHQADARDDLRREQAAEQPDEEGEDQRGDHYRWSSFTSAGTMSNRSPTMP